MAFDLSYEDWQRLRSPFRETTAIKADVDPLALLGGRPDLRDYQSSDTYSEARTLPYPETYGFGRWLGGEPGRDASLLSRTLSQGLGYLFPSISNIAEKRGSGQEGSWLDYLFAPLETFAPVPGPTALAYGGGALAGGALGLLHTLGGRPARGSMASLYADQMGALRGGKKHGRRPLYHAGGGANAALREGFARGQNYEIHSIPGVSLGQDPNMSLHNFAGQDVQSMITVPPPDPSRVENLTPWEYFSEELFPERVAGGVPPFMDPTDFLDPHLVTSDPAKMAAHTKYWERGGINRPIPLRLPGMNQHEEAEIFMWDPGRVERATASPSVTPPPSADSGADNVAKGLEVLAKYGPEHVQMYKRFLRDYEIEDIPPEAFDNPGPLLAKVEDDLGGDGAETMANIVVDQATGGTAWLENLLYNASEEMLDYSALNAAASVRTAERLGEDFAVFGEQFGGYEAPPVLQEAWKDKGSDFFNQWVNPGSEDAFAGLLGRHGGGEDALNQAWQQGLLRDPYPQAEFMGAEDLASGRYGRRFPTTNPTYGSRSLTPFEQRQIVNEQHRIDQALFNLHETPTGRTMQELNYLADNLRVLRGHDQPMRDALRPGGPVEEFFFRHEKSTEPRIVRARDAWIKFERAKMDWMHARAPHATSLHDVGVKQYHDKYRDFTKAQENFLKELDAARSMPGAG